MCGNEWESMVRKRMAGHIRRRRRLLRQNCFAGDLRGEPRLQRGVQHEVRGVQASLSAGQRYAELGA
jgi:hypothetical protein